MANTPFTFAYIVMYAGVGVYALALIVSLIYSLVSKANSPSRIWFMIGCSLMLLVTLLQNIGNVLMTRFLSPSQVMTGIATISVVAHLLHAFAIIACAYAALGKHNTPSRGPTAENQLETTPTPNDPNHPYRYM